MLLKKWLFLFGRDNKNTFLLSTYDVTFLKDNHVKDAISFDRSASIVGIYGW